MQADLGDALHKHLVYVIVFHEVVQNPILGAV